MVDFVLILNSKTEWISFSRVCVCVCVVNVMPEFDVEFNQLCILIKLIYKLATVPSLIMIITTSFAARKYSLKISIIPVKIYTNSFGTKTKIHSSL